MLKNRYCLPLNIRTNYIIIIFNTNELCHVPGISVTAPWALNWFSDENGNKVLIQIIALCVYLESISIDADMAIQGQYKYTIGSYSIKLCYSR